MAQEKSFLEILSEKIEKRILQESVSTLDEKWTPREEIPAANLNLSPLQLQKYDFVATKARAFKSAYLKNQPVAAAAKCNISRTQHKLSEEQSQAYAYFLNWKTGLRQDFTEIELKKVFRKLAMQLHPDRNLGASRFYLELKKNYELLLLVFKK